MASQAPKTILCVAGYEKGHEFIRECKRQGAHVILLTVSSLEHAGWPRESIDETYYMPDFASVDNVIKGVSYLARDHAIDRVVPLDDFDVELAAALREHLQLPGMDLSTARRFRDKLAMRVAARRGDVLVPEFVPVLNYDHIRDFMARVPPPWLLKPRGKAAAIGIKQIHRPEELWPLLDELGDDQSFYVMEQYVPGDVHHVDGIVIDGEVVFAEAHAYDRPPMDIVYGGGIFITRTMRRETEDVQALKALHRDVVRALGMTRGVTHAEFIKGRDDGRLYFLECAARVGGANIADMVEAATGINLWAEWAKIELAQGERPYELPPRRADYGGVIISLAREEHPDTSGFQDPEIVLRLTKPWHIGFVVASPDPDRVKGLLDEYARRIA
ncbi:MAG: ATPase, partial [Thermomicrobiaceae bacterium]|nr:ATPase [Thermomicrobiaceae bacterium]